MFRRIVDFFSRRRLVGTDPFGNNYFEEPGHHLNRTRRTVTMSGVRHAEHMNPATYTQNTIPAQWRAWLSHTRFEAPSYEEVVKDLEYRAMIRERAKKLDLQWQQRKAELMKTDVRYRELADNIKQETTNSNMTLEDLLMKQQTKQLSSNDGEKGSATVVNPFAGAAKGQGETFQPGEWTPTAKPRDIR